MANYLLFDSDRKGFDDGEGNEVSLGQHLEYVDNYGGTPDFDDSIDNVSYSQMKFEVGKKNRNFHVVEQSEMRVVYIAKKKEPEIEADSELGA